MIEFQPREEKLSLAEYVKSRLLNKDSQFRKDLHYIFCHEKKNDSLRQRYIIYSTQKNRPMSVGNLLHNVNVSDEELEANLSTMLQCVRGTKYFWNLRRSELQCMMREAGSPTLFLTFSCAEYKSADIHEYLRLVNEVPVNYSMSKLCTEDPISVSRQFSQKFRAFFQEVIVKGEVLGKVDHFFWKKEYQAHGAPHYHIMLLWIRDAPVIDRDDPKKMLAWIRKKYQTAPELHKLVTLYQLHKCTSYCKKRSKCGNVFVTRCMQVWIS